MTLLYNFLGSWQMFPEKGTYEKGKRPRSGTFRISQDDDEQIAFSINWVTLEGNAFNTEYKLYSDGQKHPFEPASVAHEAKIIYSGTKALKILFYKESGIILEILLELMPNGNMSVTNNFTESGNAFSDMEIYHRQMSVLPYASSAGGALIQPNETGMIKHHALAAMEEQTEMQLNQIRAQVELLARQAQEIQARKQMSVMIYNASLNFKPIIGSAYFLYEKKEDVFLLSMIGPKEWGGKAPYKKFIAHVRLLADHTWVELP